MDQRAFGIDISKYQTSQDGKKRMDFEAVRKHTPKVTFVAARVGVSWSYKDPQFDYYWEEMARIKTNRMAYFVPYFGESALTQMDFCFKALEGKTDWKYDRLALDLEVAGINPRERITATTLKCLDIVKARTGMYPVIYTRANWMNTYVDTSVLPKLHYWLAQYKAPRIYPLYTPEHPGPPDLPKGADTWLIHQTGDKCKGIGSASYFMDYNRFNGTEADVQRFFGDQTFTGQTPQPVKEQFRAMCIVSALYKRSGPGSNYPVVGTLSLGDVVSVVEVKDNWFRIDPASQVWCSGSGTYMQRLAADQAATPSLFKVRCIVSALYKREGPGSNHRIVGNLVRNQVVDVYEQKNGWYRIAPTAQVWCSAGAQYTKRV